MAVGWAAVGHLLPGDRQYPPSVRPAVLGGVVLRCRPITKPHLLRPRDEQLEAIDTDPRTEARSNRKTRAWVQRLIGASITGGLAISASTAQATVTATMGWTFESNLFSYLAAYAADPVLGLLLFATLFVQSLASNRGITVPVVAKRVFNRVEVVLFALVAVLNAGPAIAGMIRALAVALQVPATVLQMMDVLGHGFMFLVIHLLGPVLVGLAVYALPHVLDVLGQVAAQTTRRLAAQTEPEPTEPSTVSPLGDRPATVPAKWRGDLDAVLAAIDSGRLPTDPSGKQILDLVGGDATKKPVLREAVRGYRPTAA